MNRILTSLFFCVISISIAFTQDISIEDKNEIKLLADKCIEEYKRTADLRNDNEEIDIRVKKSFLRLFETKAFVANDLNLSQINNSLEVDQYANNISFEMSDLNGPMHTFSSEKQILIDEIKYDELDGNYEIPVKLRKTMNYGLDENLKVVEYKNGETIALEFTINVYLDTKIARIGGIKKDTDETVVMNVSSSKDSESGYKEDKKKEKKEKNRIEKEEKEKLKQKEKDEQKLAKLKQEQEEKEKIEKAAAAERQKKEEAAAAERQKKEEQAKLAKQKEEERQQEEERLAELKKQEDAKQEELEALAQKQRKDEEERLAKLKEEKLEKEKNALEEEKAKKEEKIQQDRIARLAAEAAERDAKLKEAQEKDALRANELEEERLAKLSKEEQEKIAKENKAKEEADEKAAKEEKAREDKLAKLSKEEEERKKKEEEKAAKEDEAKKGNKTVAVPTDPPTRRRNAHLYLGFGPKVMLPLDNATIRNGYNFTYTSNLSIGGGLNLMFSPQRKQHASVFLNIGAAFMPYSSEFNGLETFVFDNPGLDNFGVNISKKSAVLNLSESLSANTLQVPVGLSFQILKSDKTKLFIDLLAKPHFQIGTAEHSVIGTVIYAAEYKEFGPVLALMSDFNSENEVIIENGYGKDFPMSLSSEVTYNQPFAVGGGLNLLTSIGAKGYFGIYAHYNYYLTSPGWTLKESEADILNIIRDGNLKDESLEGMPFNIEKTNSDFSSFADSFIENVDFNALEFGISYNIKIK